MVKFWIPLSIFITRCVEPFHALEFVNLQLILTIEVSIALVALVGPQGSVAVIDPQTWWKFRGQEKGSVIKTWDMLLSSSIRYYFGHRTEKGTWVGV